MTLHDKKGASQGGLTLSRIECTFQNMSVKTHDIEAMKIFNGKIQEGVKDARIVERIDKDTFVARIQLGFGGCFSDREIIYTYKNTWLPNGSLLVVEFPSPHPKCPRRASCIEMKQWKMHLYEQEGPHCHLTEFSYFDMGGCIPKWLLSAMSAGMIEPSVIALYNGYKETEEEERKKNPNYPNDQGQGGYEPTQAEQDTFMPFVQETGMSMQQLPQEVMGKIMTTSMASADKAPHEKQEFLASLSRFDKADANKDGKLDAQEYPDYWKLYLAEQDEKYGGHYNISEESFPKWVEAVMKISEPHDSVNKDDLRKLAYI